MTYRKSDGPFGLLPKKAAMDLEWASGLYSVPARREDEPRRDHVSTLDPSASDPTGAQPVTDGATRRL